MNKRGRIGKTLLIITVVVLLLAAIYFTVFFYYSCDDISCFQSHQAKCAKTKFVSDSQEATWRYIIQGKTKGQCEIDVTLLQVKKGSIDATRLQGESMNCLLPIGSIVSPEGQLSNCHGNLKEGLQEMIIDKLHAYIVSNVGQVSEELEKAI